MSRTSKLALICLALLIVGFVAAKLRYPGRAPISLPASACDADLWKHTYENDRLHIIEACTAVEGQVVSVHRDEDGDLHIGLVPDDRRVLNLINATHAQRRLITEIVCYHPPTKDSARSACQDFHSDIVAAPKRGDRVRITGVYVMDVANGWNEIHPITRIEVLH